MALSWNDWKRTQGWDVFAPNPWDFTHKLKFEGSETAGTLKNMTRGGAVEGNTCVWHGIDEFQDKVTVFCLLNSKTYTITRTVDDDGKSTLDCDGGASGGSSWTAIEGG